MPLNFLVDNITGTITKALGIRDPKTTPTSYELVQETDKGITKTLEGAVKATYNALTKYWYIPVIIGGVFIGYKVLTAGQMNKLLAALIAKE